MAAHVHWVHVHVLKLQVRLANKCANEPHILKTAGKEILKVFFLEFVLFIVHQITNEL